MSRWISSALFLATLFVATVAIAGAERKITIDLASKLESMPAHVCVVTPSRLQKGSTQMAMLTDIDDVCENTQQFQSRTCGAAQPKPSGAGVSSTEPVGTESAQAARAGAKANPKKGAVASCCPATEIDCARYTRRRCGTVGLALEELGSQLTWSDAIQPATYDCSNRTFSFPEAMRTGGGSIICAPNGDHAGAQPLMPRVVVIELTAPYSAPPAVSELEVNGTGVILTVEEPQSETMVLAFKVAGGDYLPDAPVFTTTDAVRLPIVPKCDERTVDVVRRMTSSPPERVDLTIGKLATHYELSSVPATLVVPNSTAGGTRRIALSTKSSTFSTTWQGSAPPERLKLLAEKIQLTWKRHCAFASSEVSAAGAEVKTKSCPSVSLPDLGIECSEPDAIETGAQQCTYQCEVPGDSAGFEFPQRAAFHVQHEDGFVDRWQELVFFDGDVLTGYTKPSERHVRLRPVRLPRGTDFSLPDERIDYLEVRGPTGERFRVKASTGETRLHIPGLGCNDQLALRYVGRRRYFETTIQVHNGSVDVPPPHTLRDDLLTFALVASIGPSYGPFYFDGALEVHPFYSLEALVAFHAQRAPNHYEPSFGFRVGAMRLQQPYLARFSTDQTDALKSVTATQPFVIAPLKASMLFEIGRATTLEASAGVFLAFPQSSSHSDLVPWQMGPMLSFYYANFPTGFPVGIEIAVHLLPVDTLKMRAGGHGEAPQVSEDFGLFVLPTIGLRLGG